MAQKTSKKRSPATRKPNAVRVKGGREVMAQLHQFITINLHDRYSVTFSAKTKRQLVAYGPWLAAVTLLFITPELLILANSARFISPSGFIEEILFSKEAWVLLIVLFINCLSIADAIGELFNKTKRGWNVVYGALLVDSVYALWQLFTHLDQPAAPLLGLLGLSFCLFTLLDIRHYYN